MVRNFAVSRGHCIDWSVCLASDKLLAHHCEEQEIQGGATFAILCTRCATHLLEILLCDMVLCSTKGILYCTVVGDANIEKFIRLGLNMDHG